MKRVLTTQLPTSGNSVKLPESEAEHLTRVLRLRDGDVVEALDGHGNSARVTLKIKGGPARIEFLESSQSLHEAGQHIPPIHLEMSILKGDAMEWVIEKAVELGVQKLFPLMTAHTVVQLKNKGPEAFQARWQKIADQALKQCGRLERMEVMTPMMLEDLLVSVPSSADSPRLWFDEAERGSLPYLGQWTLTQEWGGLKAVKLLVGPEGGWSALERELLGAGDNEIVRLGLGPWVLRAETAALFAVSLAAAQFRMAAANSLTKTDR